MLTLGEDLYRVLYNDFARIGVEDAINDLEKKLDKMTYHKIIH